MNYSVKANIPENQINKNLTYFDLRIKLGHLIKCLKLTVKKKKINKTAVEVEKDYTWLFIGIGALILALIIIIILLKKKKRGKNNEND
ncbi:hypothetical protein COD67_23060 [Bacillus cereus]|nr:hypothetical protein COI89_19140 [Bacillus cereus]PGU62266.1 hypothetical protein COD67_23060 [Bacillus cereus]